MCSNYSYNSFSAESCCLLQTWEHRFYTYSSATVGWALYSHITLPWLAMAAILEQCVHGFWCASKWPPLPCTNDVCLLLFFLLKKLLFFVVILTMPWLCKESMSWKKDSCLEKTNKQLWSTMQCLCISEMTGMFEEHLWAKGPLKGKPKVVGLLCNFINFWQTWKLVCPNLEWSCKIWSWCKTIIHNSSCISTSSGTSLTTTCHHWSYLNGNLYSNMGSCCQCAVGQYFEWSL